MQSSLTSEQILSLAVDQHAIRTTRTWSAWEKWLRIGQEQGVVWGHFKAKSKTPVQTMLSLGKPIFSCTCPSRKLPCSHALGLSLLYLDAPHLFKESSPSAANNPASLISPANNFDATTSNATTSEEWIASLTDATSTSARASATGGSTSAGQVNQQQDEVDDARLQRIKAGLEALDLWLGDIVRNGLESMCDKKRTADWQRMARRLVDAQASELADSVRKMATISGATPHWPEELLAKMGSLHLLIQGFRNFETLSPEVQGDLRMAVGWLPKVDATAPTVQQDRWHVVARELAQMGKQRRHKLWLWGEASNRAALIVQILPNKQKQIEALVPGVILEGSLFFYPSMAPLRAELIRAERTENFSQNQDDGPPVDGPPAPITIQQPTQSAPGYANLDEAFQAAHHTFTQNPWLTHFPIMVRSAKVAQSATAEQAAKSGQSPKQQSWVLLDDTGIQLPLPAKFVHGWHLDALDESNGVHLFGIWNRTVFTPFTVWQGGRWLSLHILKGEI